MGRKKTIMQEDFNLDNFVEEVNDEEALLPKENQVSPSPMDPEWSDFVLSHLTDEEMDEKGNPTVDGLKRLVLKLIGPYTYFKPDVTPADENNNRRATVIFGISIQDHHYPTESNEPRHVFGTADAHPDNIFGNNVFKNFPASIAETRAEGRAYKRALYLRKVVTAEEVGVSDTTEETSYIASHQINVLDSNCADADIDVMAYANAGKAKYANVKEIPRAKAAQMLKLLADYKRGEIEPKVKNVIETCKGYKANWRS